jgi:hypothetical protein
VRLKEGRIPCAAEADLSATRGMLHEQARAVADQALLHKQTGFGLQQPTARTA